MLDLHNFERIKKHGIFVRSAGAVIIVTTLQKSFVEKSRLFSSFRVITNAEVTMEKGKSPSNCLYRASGSLKN